MPAVKKLSFRQRQVLEYVAKGTAYAGCNRQCDYGGRDTTLWSLRSRGLVMLANGEWSLTAGGKAELSIGGAKSILLL